MAAADNGESEEQFELEKNNAAYDNPTTLEEKSLKFNFEQNVSGTGFFTAYKYAQMPDDTGTEGRLFNGVEAKNNAHGSGIIDTDSDIYAESSYTNKTWINGAYDEDGEIIEDEEEATSVIQMKEDSKMTYSPLAMGIGSRYYSFNPIVFNSLLKEEDWIKNRDGLNSLHHLVDQAHGLNKVLDAQSDATNNTMNIEEDLVDGRAHFGVLQLQGIPVDEEPEEDSDEVQVLGLAMKDWKKPLIELDEDYIGNFHIKKNMNIYTYSEEEEKEDSWLPCCSGGFSDLNYADAKAFKSARGIFDCTCFKVPAKAQFPR
ncbi:MAG: hypothetical protein LUO89_05970 [Methanothrix sp.]|nr:hypothetical protein [Methanothrix sp.]